MKNLIQLLEEKKTGYIHLHLKEKFNYTITAENGSSIISNYPEFNVEKDHIGGYVCDELGLKFYIFDNNKYVYNREPDYVASIVFDKDKVRAENIIKLVNKLFEINFIFEK